MPRAFRAAAIVIAVLGFIDPAFTLERRLTPAVVVTASSRDDEPLAARVADELDGRYRVERGETASAAAHVTVGRRAPTGAAITVRGGVPEFAVLPNVPTDRVTIRGVRAPTTSSLDARVTALADLDVPQGGGRTVEVDLLVDGLLADRVTRQLKPEDMSITIPVVFAPASVGLHRVRVAARLDGGPESLADLIVDVTRRIWRVLVFDGRPSYASTFVRRALESDPRVELTSRTATSRNLTIDVRNPPASLANPKALETFDAVVIGAPDVFGPAEAAGLDAYLRGRGGAVVLLPDGSGGSLLARLTGVATWTDERRTSPVIVEGAAGRWPASEFLWPDRLPPGAESLAGVKDRPAVWRAPAGAGRVIVNGAVDGWRSRAAEASQFEAFWRNVIATAAEESPAPIEVRPASQLLEAGEWTRVEVSRRPSGPVEARLIDASGAEAPVRLWPAGQPGTLAGEFRAPHALGRTRLVVRPAGSASGDAVVSELAVVASEDLHRPQPDESALVSAWTTAHRGAVIPEGRLNELGAAIDRALTSATSPQTMRPMRSSWWIAPFAICLGVEWWSRRRRGAR